MEKTLLLGAGEIGLSLGRVLSSAYEVVMKDKEAIDAPAEPIRVINICYPYSDEFIAITKKYIGKYTPEVCIIHSTVPVGTTRKIGTVAVHSPVIGRHPNLEEGIRTFIKFVGGSHQPTVTAAVQFLEDAHITVERLFSSETTELAKILCTTHLGWSVVWMKEVERLCHQFHVPFDDVYTRWLQNYNDGYEELGCGFFTRPILQNMQGKIGGHCVKSNLKLLDDFVTRFVAAQDEHY